MLPLAVLGSYTGPPRGRIPSPYRSAHLLDTTFRLSTPNWGGNLHPAMDLTPTVTRRPFVEEVYSTGS
jgi:hypothetical protein